MTAAPIIEVQHLAKRYGDYVAVEDVTFAVEETRYSASSGRTVQARRRPSSPSKARAQQMVASSW